MSVQIIENNFNKDSFNNKARHPLQSWEWGEARRQMGIEVLRIGEFESDKLVNVYQVTFHKIPKAYFRVGYLPRSSVPTKQVLKFLIDYGIKNKIIFIKIEPNEKELVKDASIFNLLSIDNDSIKIEKSPHPLFPDWTQIIDLSKGEDELLKKMKPKTRYNIRLAQKKGVIIKEESNEKGFEIFSKLYFETCKRQKYFGHTPDYHQTIWENLNKSISHILTAYFNNIPLASYELFYFNKILYYPYGGSSEEYRNTMAANLLMWEAIRLGKKLGAEYFDMWGSLPPDYNGKNPWSGFTRFKEGYGARFTKMIGSYDLIINKKIYGLYNFLNLTRTVFLKLIKLF